MDGQGGAAAAATDKDALPAGGASNEADVEARARRWGWRPQEEFRGPKDKWVDAREFVERGENDLPILRERLRVADTREAKRERDVKELTDKVTEMGGVLSEFAEFSRSSEQRAYERARKDLKAEIQEAVADGNVEKFNEKQAELDNLEQTAPKPKASAAAQPAAPAAPAAPATPAKPQISEVVQTWLDDKDNDWFHKNAGMSGYATARHGENIANGMSEAESLRAVSEDVRKTFPSHFENPARKAPGSVTPPSPPNNMRQQKKDKAFEDLPKEAQKQCDRFMKQIPGFTREQYLKDYDWSQADDEEE